MKKIFTFKVLLGAVIFGVAVFAVLLAILSSARNSMDAQIPATAILKIIQAPTQTFPMPVATPSPTSTPSTSPQAPTPIGDVNIAVGKYVQVSGTGGDGLRLHNDASVSSKVNYVAIDSEVFLVQNGPIDADGYVWWELEDPFTDNAVGWGVSNYLMVVQNP